MNNISRGSRELGRYAMSVVVNGLMGKGKIHIVDDYLITFEFELKVADYIEYIVRVSGWEAWDAFMLYMEGRKVHVTGQLESDLPNVAYPRIVAYTCVPGPVERAINLTDLGKKINMLSDANSEALKRKKRTADYWQKNSDKAEKE